VKKIFLIGLLFFLTCHVRLASQTLIWSENFEGNASGWMVIGGTWQIGYPTVGPGMAYSGLKCASTGLDSVYGAPVETRLMSPPFTIPATVQDVVLRFWQWYHFSCNDYGKVQIKVTGSSEWNDLTADLMNGSGGIWSSPSASLNAFKGQSVQLSFFFHSEINDTCHPDFGWFIDELTVMEGDFSMFFPETWENGLGNWSVDQGSWEVGEPSSGPGAAFNSLQCAGTVLDGNTSRPVKTRLISPTFLVPDSIDNPRLTFWHWFFTSCNDYGLVQVRILGTNNWVDLASKFAFTSGGVWSVMSLSLKNFNGKVVQIAFLYTAGPESGFCEPRPGWYIDNIELKTGPEVVSFPEGWENGIGDWYVDQGNWEIGSPIMGPDTAFSGLFCAQAITNANYPGIVDSRLVSPPFFISNSIQNPRLVFAQWIHLNCKDYAKVQIKASDETTWTTLSEIYPGNNGNDWIRTKLRLNQFSSKTVRIAFYIYSEIDSNSCYTGQGWFIDDIEFTSTPDVFNNPEDLENGLSDWYVDHGNWNVGELANGPGGAFSGLKCASTFRNNVVTGTFDSRLISPSILVPDSSQHPRLRFWHWYNLAFYDYGRIQIRVSGTSSWTNLSDTYTNSSGLVWTETAFSLKSYAGLSIEISFLYHSGIQWGGINPDRVWVVDSIAILTGPELYNNPEGWETGLGDWYVDQGTWEVGIPLSGPGSAFSGQQCAATVLNGNVPRTVNSRLISPEFVVPDSSQNPHLSFWSWYAIACAGYGKVQARVAGTQNWVDISSPFTNSGGNSWTASDYALAAFAGKKIQLAFLFHAQNSGLPCYPSDGWYIDNIFIGNHAISGKLVYENPPFNSALACVKVYLLNNSGVATDSTITAYNGNYSFFGIQAGAYMVTAMKNSDAGGFNSTDALLAMKHFTGLIVLTGLKLNAADADGNGMVNSMDALMISKRAVSLLSSFPTGDWKFQKVPVNYTGSSSIIVDLKGICTGDVNGSYFPPGCGN
jgi:hypothetical protein